MENTNEILFENLAYGAYALIYDADIYTENLKFASAEFNKLHTRKIRLPDGKGNIAYLLSDTFEHSVNMVNGQHFIIPTTYRKFFYPTYSIGTFMRKRYKISITNNVKKQRSQLIASKTKMRPVLTKTLNANLTDNVAFSISDIYEQASLIASKFTIKNNIASFFPELFRIINLVSPPLITKQKKTPGTRLMIIDASAFSFKQGAKLDENKTNPLYLLYLAFLRNRSLKDIGVDMDILIYSNNLFLKFNPAKLDIKQWNDFRKGLFRIMGANLDTYTDSLSNEEKQDIDTTSKDHSISAIVNDAIDPFTKMTSIGTKTFVHDTIENKVRQNVNIKNELIKATKDETKAVAKSLGTPDPSNSNLFMQSLNKVNKAAPSIMTPQDKQKYSLFNSLDGNYHSLGTPTGEIVDDEDIDEEIDYEHIDEDEIRNEANMALSDNEQIAESILDEIQENTVPLKNPKTAPINSARDAKLREQQKKVVVKNETIEEILERDMSMVKLQADDKSAVLHTSNQNMKNIKFTNFDKFYIDNLYARDIVACFDMLKDKESPFYIKNIDVQDTSTAVDLKETWTVTLVDEVNKKHTIKVDIPKFIDYRFMLIDGTKYIILKQNFYNPLVKDTPDTVIITTNYFKITVDRKATKSLSTIERIFSLIKKTGDTQVFVTGDSTRGNMKYISTLEYDELSRRLFKFSSNGCDIYFSRDYINENFADKIPSNIKGDEFFIGFEGSTPILINEDTGLDRNGRTIADIIEENLSEDYRNIFKSIKSPNQTMYAECKLAGQWLPVATVLLVWLGISKMLNTMGINWKFHSNMKRVPPSTNSTKYIRFSNGVLEYQSKIFAELILNGLSRLRTENFTFEDFETEVGYNDYLYSKWGNYKGASQIKTFYEFLIDPITKESCKKLSVPYTSEGLLIHAVKLLCDNAYVSKADDRSYRTRSTEMIPAILYSLLARQYDAYVNSGRRLPMTLNRRAVISNLLKEKTIDTYSTLNPVIEMSKMSTISTKGYKGSNSEFSYDEKKRSYDPTAVGKLAISTSADANVGINKSLVIEPTISDARGFRDQVEDPEELKDVNVFSAVEMLTPGTARYDDPIRTAIAGKQSQHVVAVADAAPGLVSNGYDEAVQFQLSEDFVVNAEEDGKVIDVNEELGIIMVQYKSGKVKAINTSTDVVKNSGGGFYVSNQLIPTKTKVGQTFKKDEPLAYHNKFFRYSELNGLRYAIGPIVKVAFMSSYNTYEDAGICTHSLAERMKSAMVYREACKFKKNNNILSMVKIGDHVNIGDILVKFDQSVEDNEIAKYLSKLSEDNQALLEEETKNDIKASHAGKVISIRVYTLLDPSALSPSLGAIVQEYFDKGISKKEYLDKFDSTDSVIKAGYLLKDSTEPIVNRYNSIMGIKGIDVLIEIYIEHDDVMAVGDKIALYSANKQIVSQVIPKGYEPYSEFRPEEEISVMTSPGTIARRMTSSVIPISAAFKVCIELKRKIAAEIKFK